MAITKTTIGINTGNVSTIQNEDVLGQLEEGFEWLGWHGGEVTGTVIGITTFLGSIGSYGSDVGKNISRHYHNVKQVSSSGVGTDATFYMRFYNGYFTTVHVNNPGYGYTGGEILQLSSEDYGGSENGLNDIQIKIHTTDVVSTGTTTVAIGLTGQYYATGEDRNGIVDGQKAAITIREGDTLTITANQDSSNYKINILWFADDNTTPSNLNTVWNVLGQDSNGNNNATISWTPLPGQAGTYYLRDNSGSYGSVTPVIFVEPADYGSITTTSYGSNSTFIAKETSPKYPWSVAKHVINPNKKRGITYRAFSMLDNSLITATGSGFAPYKSADYSSATYTTRTYSGGPSSGYRFTGIPNIDIPADDSSHWGMSYETYINGDGFRQYYSSNYPDTWLVTGGTGYQLNLNIYRSGIDPNFAVFSFMMPTISSTSISDRTFATFFIHNFETSVWDLDELFLGGATRIIAEPSNISTSAPRLTFRTYTNSSYHYSSGWYTTYRSPVKRAAEFGYTGWDGNNSTGALGYYVDDVYRSQSARQNQSNDTNRIYFRDSFNRNNYNSSYVNDVDTGISSNADFNAVIKGIPINSRLVPIPYYIPDDFVLIDFRYSLSSVNIQQGDTITVSPSEVYTVITGSYNQSGVTRGILFCARTV